MFLFLIACTTPEKAAAEHTDILCSYLEECQILNTFDYSDINQCVTEEIVSVSEEQTDLLVACNDSLLSASCSAVYNEDIYITMECSNWLQATAEPDPSLE